MVWFMSSHEVLDYTASFTYLDGDRRKIEYVDTTIELGTLGGLFKPGDMGLGRAIKLGHVPTRGIWDGPTDKLPDVIGVPYFLIVNQKFKDIVEGFEPAVHQFFPMEVTGKDGGSHHQMYLFNICNRLDTVDRNLTTSEFRKVGWIPPTGKMVFSLKQIGDHHVWIDKHISAPAGFFISDALQNELAKAKLIGAKYGNREETSGDQ